MKLEYKIYRAACKVSNVKPSRGDYLNGEIPDRVIHVMGLEQNEKEWERRKSKAATAGR